MMPNEMMTDRLSSINMMTVVFVTLTHLDSSQFDILHRFLLLNSEATIKKSTKRRNGDHRSTEMIVPQKQLKA